VRTRLALVALLAVTACSSSGRSAGGKDLALDSSARPTTTASAAASTGPAPARTTAPPAPRTATGPVGRPGTPAPSVPQPRTAAGKPASSKATAPGTYTYDATGTVTYGVGGSPRDASGAATLTVSPVKGGRQHSALHSDSTGDTEQDLLVRDTGTFAAGITLTSPVFQKVFRPSPAALLVPDPAKAGAAWTWSATSTDGATTVRASNKVLRTETLRIGDQRVLCAVLQTRIVLTGDLDYQADVTTWWAPSHRLPVKDHTVGKGSFNGVPFSTDITGVMRSITPS
jgi:hypothetical protein